MNSDTRVISVSSGSVIIQLETTGNSTELSEFVSRYVNSDFSEIDALFENVKLIKFCIVEYDICVYRPSDTDNYYLLYAVVVVIPLLFCITMSCILYCYTKKRDLMV